MKVGSNTGLNNQNLYENFDGELTHNNNNRAIRGGNKIPQTCKNL
jgi:hypothetical protein